MITNRSEVVSLRVEIQSKVAVLEESLLEAKQELAFLQMQCPHPNLHTSPHDDCLDQDVSWCNDCGGFWENCRF
ncbi:MAG: hypothetical protein HYX21_01015 [Candidatus Yanofskybacteria bacterium]|nr:hypothetical protein [Candidatus Yanofskybacteria bacterium]